MINYLEMPDGTRYTRVDKKRYTGWRLKYPSEGGNYNPTGMPGVCPALRWVSGRWAKYIPAVKMTKAIQDTQWELMRKKNLPVTSDRFTKTYFHDIALTNNQGFGDPQDPRWNFVTGADNGSPLPKLMDAIIMAGQLYQGVVEGNMLAQYPGVHAVDASNIIHAQDVLDREWAFRCVSWHEAGYGEDFFPLRGGEYWSPHIISEKATYPLEYFQWWDKDYSPDPLKVYL